MVILVGGDGGRRAVRVGSIVVVLLVVLVAALSAAAPVEVLGVMTENAPPALVVAATDDAQRPSQAGFVTVHAEPDGVAGEVVPTGTLVRRLDEVDGWVRVDAFDGSTSGWVRASHLRARAHVAGQPAPCPVPLRGEPDGQVFAVLASGAPVTLVDGHRGPGGATWVGVQAGSGGVLGVVPAALVVVSAPVEATPRGCPAVTVDPAAGPHMH